MKEEILARIQVGQPPFEHGFREEISPEKLASFLAELTDRIEELEKPTIC